MAERNLPGLEMRKPAAAGAGPLKTTQIIAEPADFYVVHDSEIRESRFYADHAYPRQSEIPRPPRTGVRAGWQTVSALGFRRDQLCEARQGSQVSFAKPLDQ